MEVRKYLPNYTGVNSKVEITPLPFVTTLKGQRPKDNFIVSKDFDGNIISTYGDDTWDFTPYRLNAGTGSAKLNFKPFSISMKLDLKWLVFILLFISDSGRATGLSIGTIKSYFSTIKILAKHCEEYNIGINELLEDQNKLSAFVSITTSRSTLKRLSALLNHLIDLPLEATGYRVPASLKHNTVRKRIKDLDEDKQHPVIPTRIYSSLITQLERFLFEFHGLKENFNDFMTDFIACDRYGRSESAQKKIGYKSSEFKPFFKEAAEEHGLWEIFLKYNIRGTPSLTRFITRVQHGCRIMMHIYSGMRSSELLSLKIGAMSISGNVHKLSGTTTKFIGQKKSTSWITSKDVMNAYEIAETLAKLVSKKTKLPENETPLFISTTYLSTYLKLNYNGNEPNIAYVGQKTGEIYNLLDQKQFCVTENDLDELEKISPFRAWESEKAFSVGSVWRFTTHQFRRSLAFYVAQSALVSLPTLKRQLKHVTRDMSVYYCQSSKVNEEYYDKEHIANLMQVIKPEADAISYISEVLNSVESLHGAHGTFIDNNQLGNGINLILHSSRDQLIKQFKDGEIAYSQTPLGACTTVVPCDQKLLRSMTSCLTCSRSVIKQSKLDRVIARQQLFVDELEDNAPDSVELRTEKEELRHLLEYKKRIMGKAR